MRKNVKSILAILFLSLVVVSCEKDDKLDSNSFLPENDKWAQNSVDGYIYDKFTQPFNIGINYRWDRNQYGPGLDNKRNLYPAKLENIQPAMEMVDKVWIQSYVEVAGKEFIQRIRPGRFLLAGGYALNDDGTRTLGLASGGVQVTLYEVDFLQKNVEAARQFIHTIQHEYIHIINQDVEFNELEFGQKNFGSYTSIWYLLDSSMSGKKDVNGNSWTLDSYANILGFVTGYSRSNTFEDFAETASYLLSTKPAQYKALLASIRRYDAMTVAQRAQYGLTVDTYKEGGADKIERKVALVKDYFMKNFSIDFDELIRVANKNADESPMLNKGLKTFANPVFGIQKFSNSSSSSNNSGSSSNSNDSSNLDVIRYCQGHADVSTNEIK